MSVLKRDKDSIHIHQVEIAENFKDSKPSTVNQVYWIYAKREKGKYPKPTGSSGKWLIYVSSEDVDKVWDKIKKATEAGKLGGSSKVATAKAKANPNSTSKVKVICVYTYNWQDEVDVRRVREQLRKLGIENKISYKADEDTMLGKYSYNTKGRISKYYE